MARQMVMFCNRCYKNQMIVYGYKSHGLFGGHEDWHCSVFQVCDYDAARN